MATVGQKEHDKWLNVGEGLCGVVAIDQNHGISLSELGVMLNGSVADGGATIFPSYNLRIFWEYFNYRGEEGGWE